MQFDFANRYLVIQTATADGRSLDDAVLEDNLVAAAADERPQREQEGSVDAFFLRFVAPF